MAKPIVFPDRMYAARELVRRLGDYQGQNPIVMGVPRGAVPMAELIARELGGELDIVLVHKIGHPQHPEYAVGSVTEEGEVFLGEGAKRLGLTKQDLHDQALAEIEALKRKRELFSPGLDMRDVRGRVVIVIDDGIATGATMTAAVRSLVERGAEKIVVATPVASVDAVERLEREGVEVVTLAVPQVFFSVSQFYDEFPQVEDDEVQTSLARARKRARNEAQSSGQQFLE